MIIGLDWDGTYTEDPQLWDQFIQIATQRGHFVRIVTRRSADTEAIVPPPRVPVIYTARAPKKAFAPDINVWIDDAPEVING